MEAAAALWSRVSWDNQTLRQDPTRQNQSPATEHKEKDGRIHTRVHLHARTNIHSHNMLQTMSSVLVQLQNDSLCMSRQRVIDFDSVTQGEDVRSPNATGDTKTGSVLPVPCFSETQGSSA